jgi:nucleoredoxin
MKILVCIDVDASKPVGQKMIRSPLRRASALLMIAMGAWMFCPQNVRAEVQKGQITHDMKVGATQDVLLKAGQIVQVLKQSGQTVVIMAPASDGSPGIYQIDEQAITILPAAAPPNVTPVVPKQATSVAVQTPTTALASLQPPETANSTPSSPPAKTNDASPSGLAADLEGHLVTLDNGELQPVDTKTLQGVKYWAIYFSASWCPDCVPITPELVRFYRNFKADHPNFELILVCHDKTSDAMINYMKTDEMPWPALPFSDVWNTRLWPLHYVAKGIPNLVLIDETGKVLSQTYQAEVPRSPLTVVDDIKTMVPQPATQL